MTDRLIRLHSLHKTSQILAGLALLLPLIWWLLAPAVLSNPPLRLMLSVAIEMTTVFIGILAFCVVWSTRTGDFSASVLSMACAMLVAAGVDGAVHIPGYFGIPGYVLADNPGLVPDSSIYGRALLATVLLATAAFPRFVLDTSFLQRTALVLTVALGGLIYWSALPGGDGLQARLSGGPSATTSVNGTYWSVATILLLSAMLFWRQIREQERQGLSGFFMAASVLLLSELSLGAGKEINGVFILLAPVYKVIAYYFFCHAIFIGALLAPCARLSEIITSRQRELEAQGQALSRSEALLGESPLMLWAAGAESGRNWFNQRWINFTGATMEQLLGSGWLEYVHAEDRTHCLATYGEAFSKRQVFSMEYRLRHRGGTYLWLLDQGMPVYDADEQFTGFAGGCLDISDRVRMCSHLEFSVERLRLALEIAQQGIYDLNVQTGEAYVTAGYASMLDYDPATFQESIAAWTERLHPDDRAGAVDTFRRYLNGELPAYRVEFRQLTGNGEWKWILSVGKLIERNANNQPLRMLGSHTDISWRKQLESEREQILKQAETARRDAETSWRLLDSVFSRVNDGFVALDNDWRYNFVSPSAARMLQRPAPADLIGKHIWSEFPESVEQPFYKACLAARQSQQAVLIEQHIQPWDLWIENRIYPSSDGLTIYFAEITARKRMESAMAKQIERLQQAEAHARLGCWEFDVESGQFWWSAQTYAMLGIKPTVEVPRFPDYLSGLHPDDLPAVLAAMGEMESAIVPAPLLFRSSPELGPMRWFSTTVRRIENFEGKIKFAGTLLDVTAIKSAELALREAQENLTVLNRDLEQRVKERTEQLHALNQSLESFVYSVSHDLKAPLRGVEGYSKLLQEDCSEQLGSEGRLFINNIRAGVTRMNELIDDLLDYSRIDRRTMESSSIELLPLLEQIVIEQIPDQARRDALVKNALPSMTVLADRNGLKLALRNLLENAIKFSSQNATPCIEINGTEAETSITMSIRDNGIGFDLKYHDRIFEIFQRLHRVEDYPGTGIGLALVKKALQRMGGRVWAESQPGAGAVFYIELPKLRQFG